MGLLLAVASAQAASVTVTVQSASGQPLADAVVTLEPATGRLPVKPMAPVDIAQAKRQFNPSLTVITTGTAVNFPNFDTVRHHVYSFSPAKTFELKLYAGVPNVPLVFDKPGVAVLGCNIHDQMAAWVVVVDTPLFARSNAEGRVRLDGVASGSYRLRTWHRQWPVNEAAPTQPLQVATTDVTATVRLPVEGPP